MTARPILELRARIRRGLRGVFDGRGFVEVDTPVLSREVLPEAQIDPIPVFLDGDERPRFLQASPEALMKRLLAQAAGPIYQFAESFRAGERGRQHDVEFCLLEWYEPGSTLDDAVGLLDALCAATLGSRGLDRTTCRDAFAAHAGVDPLAASVADLEAAVVRHGVVPPAPAGAASPADRWDRAFELLLAEVVQPRLGRGRPTMLVDWPASQAAFARLDPRCPGVARRFELFVEGVELANGWEEDPSRELLAARIATANRTRAADGRGTLPVPERLLAAHGETMPEGVGAALGFDRLVMLAAGADSIAAVRSFTGEA
jgi:elongation factor P--(R)-beta-lysine ligase